LVEGFLIPDRLNSTNARTERNNVEANSNKEATIFCVDKFQTMQERKRNGTSKEEEFHVATLGKNRGKGKKVVNFSIIEGSFFAKSNS
jgi:hypothetical protein